MKRPDILAPAGGMDSLISGVYSGADAVYMGWSQLNARRNAKNFTREEFLQAASFCRARGVKLYMTLNTTVYDRELELVKEALSLACEAQVNGIIVQDMGVAALARELCPQLSLHGSTQMVVHSLSGALALKELGYDCAVLARELSAGEIALITKESGIPTEIFVHGALCMCVSGQCYMSAMIGERSGNRGLCAQACRLPFSPTGNKEEYALSLKDACLIPKLQEISRMGVSTLKIEGRMKRPEYVAAAVDACRKALDSQPVDYTALQSVFSRSGFTTGYYDGKLTQEMFGVRSKEDVTAAGEVLRQLAALYKTEYPRVEVDFTLTLEEGCPARLTAEDGQRQVTVTGEVPQRAVSRPTDEEGARKALSKLGGTYYKMGSLTCRLDGGLMLPVSALNELRRKALAELSARREQLTPIPFIDKPLPKFPQKAAVQPALRAVCSRAEQATAQMAEHCEFIALPMEELEKADISRLRDKLIIQLPHVCFGDDMSKLTPRLEYWKEQGITRLSACHIGGVYLGRKLGFTVHGDYGLNITNSLALKSYGELGLADAVVSYELSMKRAKALGDFLPYGILAYGRLPLMVTRSCPLDGSCKKCAGGCRSLIDRKNARFPVRCYEEYKEILNSAPLYLADKKEELEGFDFIALLFTDESPAHCDGILKAYREGGEKRENITRGLYFRNVQ